MDFDALAPVDLARRAFADADAASSVSTNPAEVLALLMDFSGSVALAKVLHAPAPEGPSHPDAASLAQQLQARVQRQIEALAGRSLRPLEGARAPVVPSPLELFDALARCTGTPGVRPGAAQGAAVAELARELGAPLRAALGACLRQSQAHFAAVRHELTPELHRLGPRARRLERIDAALQRSIAAKVAQLFERMELAAELTFERACAEACATLPMPPETFAVEALVPWAADSGWIAHYRRRCLHVARGFFDHLRRGLEALLSAASEAEVES